jgi:hypothetical protein
MKELLNRQEQDNLIQWIESSGLCNSDERRRAFLIESNLNLQGNRVEVEEHTFLVNLIDRLVQTQNQDALRSIIKIISPHCDRNKLRFLEDKLKSRSYRPSLPTAKPAYFLEDRAFQHIPCDIGTIWGLQRSSFIGLLIGYGQAEIYENLKNVENYLSMIIKENNCSTQLPKREWVKLNINQHLGIPFTKDSIIDMVVDASEEIANTFNNKSFSKSSVPGFFLEIEANLLDINFCEHIQNCCHFILDLLFPRCSTAIVINITHSIDEDINSNVTVLRQELQNGTGEVPVELMYLDPRPFFSNEVLRKARLTKPHAKTAMPFISSEILIDYLVRNTDISTFSMNSFTKCSEFDLDMENRNNKDKIDSLFIAFLRKYWNLNDNKIVGVFKEIIRSYPHLEELYYCFHEDRNEKTILDKDNPHLFSLALRAKIGFGMAINKFKDAHVNDISPSLCWLIAAMPINQINISELLKLAPKKRIIFGLCTSQEYKNIKKRQEEERQILDCRRNRPLIFTPIHL